MQQHDMVLKTIVGVETLEISQWLSTPDFVRVVRTLLLVPRFPLLVYFRLFPWLHFHHMCLAVQLRIAQTIFN